MFVVRGTNSTYFFALLAEVMLPILRPLAGASCTHNRAATQGVLSHVAIQPQVSCKCVMVGMVVHIRQQAVSVVVVLTRPEVVWRRRVYHGNQRSESCAWGA